MLSTNQSQTILRLTFLPHRYGYAELHTVFGQVHLKARLLCCPDATGDISRTLAFQIIETYLLSLYLYGAITPN
jgi:hypothetical protein